MTILGWSASSYYARTRNSALLVAMLFLACALLCAHSIRAHAQAPAAVPARPSDTEYPIRSAKELVIALRTNSPDAQRSANAVLKRADPAMVEELIRYGQGSRRELAQRVLLRMGGNAVPALMNLLDDEALGVSAGAALYQILDTGDFERIPALIACARTKESVKNYCATALVKVSSAKAAAHVPALAACLTGGDHELRAYCAAALGRIGAKAAPATDALISALGDAEPVTRARSAAALGAIGRGAAKAAPALRRALKDSSSEVSREARAALRKVGA